MKQSDIFTLILVAGIGTLASFFVCNALLGDPDEASTEFTRLSQVISADLTDLRTIPMQRRSGCSAP